MKIIFYVRFDIGNQVFPFIEVLWGGGLVNDFY